MLNFIKEYRHYFLITLMVVIPLLALSTGKKTNKNIYWFDNISLRIIYPIQSIFSWGINSLNNGVQNYLLLLKVKENNTLLQKKVQSLLAEISFYKEVVSENQRLKKLVQFSKSMAGKKIIAQVIARDMYQEFHSLRLNKGSSHGVKVGMAVVNPDGVIGRIISTDKSYSNAVTLLNSSFSISGIAQKSRSTGIVQGYKNSLLRVKYLHRTDNVAMGDTIISTGIGNIFPKGLPIGKVIEVKKEK